MSKKITLQGKLIKSDGSEEKSNLFDFLNLPLDDYGEVSYTPEEAKKVASHMRYLTTGAAAVIPLICPGPNRCPMSQRCPFVRIDRERKKQDPDAKMITPVGKTCGVEAQLLSEWTTLYIQEYGINPDKFTEFQLVRELAETELLLWRLNNNMAKVENCMLVQENVVGVDREGTPLTRQEVSSFLEARDRLLNRKSKIIKMMVGDREGQYKREAALKLKPEDDPSTSSAKLKGELSRLLSSAKRLDKKIKEKEGDIIDVETDEKKEAKPLTPEDLLAGDK